MGLPALAAYLLLGAALAGAATGTSSDDPLPEGALRRLGSARLRHGGSVNALAFSPDGKSLASGGEDRTVSLWSVSDGQELWRRRQWWTVTGLTFSEDGARLVSSGADGIYYVRDASTGEPLLRVPGERERKNNYRPHPLAIRDGKLAAPGPDGVVQLVDMATGLVTRRLEALSREVTFLAWRPGRAGPLAGYADCSLRAAGSAAGRKLEHCVPWSRAHAVSPDGRLLATSGETGAFVFDLSTGRQVRSFPGNTDALSFSAGSRLLAAAAPYSGVTLWDLETGAARLVVDKAHSQTRAAAVSPDGTILASAGYGGEIRLWQVPSGRELNPSPGHTGSAQVVAFSPDGRTLASGGSDSRLILWDWRGGTPARRLDLGGHVEALAFLPGGRIGAAGAHRAAVWDSPASTAPAVRIPLGGWGGWAFAFSPDGRLFASGAREIVLWDLASGSVAAHIPKEDWHTSALAFSPDSRQLVACRWRDKERQLLLWETGGARSTAAKDLPRSTCGSPFFSRQSRHLLTGTHYVTWWDLAQRPARELASVGIGWGPLAVSADERSFATVAQDGGAIQVFDLRRPGDASGWAQPRRVFPGGHRGRVTSLAFSPDGQTLASSGDDSTVLVWALAPRPSRPLPPVEASDSAPPAPPPPPKDSGPPVVHLSFDGTLSGPGVIPTVQDGRSARFVKGVEGKALHLDGKLEFPELEERLIPGSFTLEFRFRFSAGGGPAPNTQFLSCTPFSVGFMGDGRLHLALNHGTGGHTSLRPGEHAAPLQWGRWHHLALAYDDESKTVRIFLDGSLVMSLDNRSRPADRLGELKLGQEPWGDKPGFRGDLDDLALYDYARSDAQIAADAKVPRLKYEPEAPDR